MVEVLQQLFNGIVIGSGYALISVGLTVIFGLMKVVNFAHGEFYMIGGVMMYYLANTLGLNFFLTLALSVLGTMVVGYFTDLLILQPLRRKGSDSSSAMLAMIGLSVLLQNLVLETSGPVPKIIKSPFPQAPIELGGVMLQSNRIFAAILTMAVVVLADRALRKTSFGRDLRATFQDSTAASLVGIPIDSIYRATFALGAGLASLAGALLGSIFLVYPAMGEAAVSKAFVVVIVGGLGNFRGAIAVGMLLGIAETFAAGYVSSGYKDAIGFVAVVFVLLYKPLIQSRRARKLRAKE